MSNYPVYSTLFHTLHNEPAPVGCLGRGTHYSILRSVEWRNVIRTPLALPQTHDFSIIWDEDHDTRVIAVIEKLYMRGLLSPVQFIGERKGGLTLILASRFYYGEQREDVEDYLSAVQGIACDLDDDPWEVDIGSFDRAPLSDHQCDLKALVNDVDHKVLTYLKAIDNLWNLGTKDFYTGELCFP